MLPHRRVHAFSIYHPTKRQESLFGADVLLCIRYPGGSGRRLALQAKKLYPTGRYTALARKDASGIYQIDVPERVCAMVGGLCRPTCSITTSTRYLPTGRTGSVVEPTTPSNSLVPSCPPGVSAKRLGLAAVAPSQQYMHLGRIALGDAFSIATSPWSRWMSWRCCNQGYNPHAARSCSTAKAQTGYRPIRTQPDRPSGQRHPAASCGRAQARPRDTASVTGAVTGRAR